ncbi:DUF4337 domain-containing protein [bacterium]|nr:DUF4337 domain-containing protein [bacterium]NUN44221.1 DUF4337 domain-containing protein [bacterium]
MADEKEQNDELLEKGAALSTAIIGVFLSISSILGGNANDDIMIHRGLANNQWSYFQAKSTKQALYEVNRKMFETQLADPSLAESYKKEIQVKLEKFDAEVARYDTEKKEIKAKAEEHEKLSDQAAEIEDKYDYAEGFYQIAIILAAVAMIAGNRKLWLFSMVLGSIAIAITGFAFFVSL